MAARFDTHLFDRTMNNSTLRSMKQSVMFDDFNMEQVVQEEETQKVSLGIENERVAEMEGAAARLLSHLTDTGFNKKYGLDFTAPHMIHSYLLTQQPRQYTYVFEAFASVCNVQPDVLKRKKEELEFHAMFEAIIERYTNTRAKPNPVLLETRNSEFCYRLAIVVEAVPIEAQASMAFNMSNLRLLREFEILYYVWEKYRIELEAKACTHDQLIGIPMPFEFVNISGTEYDFDLAGAAISYFDIHGAYVPVKAALVPTSGRPMESFLSYMSREKLGPSLSYLGDLLRSQKKWFSVSTALKVLDQLLCRLMVLHRYGIILGNLDLRHLNFGVREALNVVYVNNFDCAVVAPTTQRPLQYFNERFASSGVLKGAGHFVNDIESAFYIFLGMLVPRLPWDDRDPSAPDFRDGSLVVTSKPRSANRTQLEERMKLWDSTTGLDRVLNAFRLNTDGNSRAMDCFAYNVVQTVYVKTKDAITTCASIPQQEFMTNAMTPSTNANNAYTAIRKVIVSYFQFESLTNSLRDIACQNKVERLVNEEGADPRALWDLNDWCWNAFETAALAARPRASSKRSVRF